ncbi:hypothetical protein L7F22_029647 [Adiantum nelumboides]|nr:hypothetical protein [Adiantum nelumboides]
MKGGSQLRLLVSWLQHMIGPLKLSIDPSEEDLRFVLQDGTVLCNLLNKVNPDNATAIVKGLDSLPTIDRVKLFLSAAAEMRLPLFEVGDLDKACYSSSSCKRIVDCLLSVKYYHERNQAFESLNNPSCLISGSSQHTITTLPDNSAKLSSWFQNGIQKTPIQPRKRWAIPGYESANSSVAADHLEQKISSLSYYINKNNEEDLLLTAEQSETGPSIEDIKQINQRVRDILVSQARRDSLSVGLSPLAKSLELACQNVSTQSLSSFVTAVFGNKQHEEVAGLVEFMLRKVLEVLERCFTSQNQQVAKLKCTLKEHLNRENILVSRAILLETVAAGAGEEVKILSSQLLRLKDEYKITQDEKRMKEAMIETLQEEGKRCEVLIENLKQELDQITQLDQNCLEQLELEKIELEQSLEAEMVERQALLQESKKKVQELEAIIAQEVEGIKRKTEHYRRFIRLQLQLLWDVKDVLRTIKQEVLFLQFTCQEDLKTVEEQLCGMVHAAMGYHKVLAENRLLYNEVQDLKGNIRVYCRVRPFLLGQSTKHSTIEFIGENGDILISNPLKRQGKETRKVFTFNKVFRACATQEEVFMDTRPLIRSVLDGFNVCIFAYGQTGSGKTYTMSGPTSFSEKDWGVNYRALNDLFQISRDRKDVISYEVGVQMLEIYNEQVRDLLLIDSSNRRLEIRNNSQLNGINVPDACMLPVNSTSDVFQLMKIGQKNRAVGATALNERSSRSHSVLTVHVQGTELASGTVLHGCLHLVDLAGSERVDRSEATGDRLKEAQYINRSLSALGDVVSALAQKSSHVPYRNSKLTQLLQESLGGQAKTLMFVHISPDIESYGETLSTLKFAERVASVELGAAKSNKESRELRDLKDQVALLKEVVSKKDMEIERLNMTKGKMGLDKSKARGVSGFLSPDAYLDIQDPKLRRQTLDSKLHLEGPSHLRPPDPNFVMPLHVSAPDEDVPMGIST